MLSRAIFAALLLGGCAGTTVQPIRYGNNPNAPGIADEKAGGIRYYESAPFLLVYSDGKGGLQSQILYLPDRTRMRSIDPYAYFASNEATLVFDHGVLTQGKSVIDETVVPKAIVGALEKAATSVLAGALNEAGGKSPTQLPPPQLFRIVINGHGARLVGGWSVGQDGKTRMIDVTISVPDKEGDGSTTPAGDGK